MKSKLWLIIWSTIVIVTLTVVSLLVYTIDPYFCYHKPDTGKYYYTLDFYNHRYVNAGICKHFDYDTLITGSSMTDNFKTTECDEIFNATSIKVPFKGGTYKEINDCLKVALKHNDKLKTIIRCLDMEFIIQDKDYMNSSWQINYPTYLYDDIIFNDVKYLFNKDVIFSYTYPMLYGLISQKTSPGITSFDDYESWSNQFSYGLNAILPKVGKTNKTETFIELKESDKNNVKENITQNVTSLVDKYPNVDFYYYISPYDILWWEQKFNSGLIYRQLEAEKYAIELILEHPNIHLYSFNLRTDITTDLNNYEDTIHYGEWINTIILKWLKDGTGILTKENYEDYCEKEKQFYTSYDYSKIYEQEDYECDLYAVALLNKELEGVEPINLLESNIDNCEYAKEQFIENQYQGRLGLKCEYGAYYNQDFYKSLIGKSKTNNTFSINVHNLSNHRYLSFRCKSINNELLPSLVIYNGVIKKTLKEVSCDLNSDKNWHQYVVDLQNLGRNLTFEFGYNKSSENENIFADCVFSDIVLY